MSVPPKLLRSMGGFGALLITLSQLSPSIGVFVVGSDVIHQAGTAAFACFAIAGVLGVAIANIYAELAAAFPETGGEYTIVGRVLGPAWGFAMLGLNLFTFSIAPASTALGVAAYLDAVVPGLPPVPVALVLVVLCMGVSMLNVRVNAWVTGVFLAVEVASLGLVAWLGFAHPARAIGEALHPLAPDASGALHPISLAGLGVGVAAAIYAFDGYGAAVYLGEEIHDAPRRMAKVVLGTLGLAAVFLLVPMLAVQLGAPDLKTLIASETPVPDFVKQLAGPAVAKVMSLGVALALFNAMIANAVMGGRHLYASGRDRAWPARVSEAFARLHLHFNSPWIANLVLGGATLLWCFVKLDVLLILIGNGAAALYGCMAIAALKGRQGLTKASPYRMPLFPALPVLALIGLAGLAVAGLADADGRKGVLIALAVGGGFALYYLAVLRRRGGWAHRGPGAAENG